MVDDQLVLVWAARCSRSLNYLRSYATEWDEHARTFRKTHPAHNCASHVADAFRYLTISWREPMHAEDGKPDRVKQLLKEQTWNDVWESRVDEQLDAGAEYDEGLHAFNLNKPDNTLEMK